MSSASSTPLRTNPFPGLRPFTQEEDYLFFGREEQTLELLQRLGSNRFVAVVGTSGSGKSSLVRCGLLSELLGGRMLDAGSSWEIAVTHPGGNPLALLTDALLDADLYDREQEHARENLLATLSRSHFGLVEAIKQSDIGEGTNFLLVVDQFEEIFRFQDAGQRQQEVANEFVSLLLEAVSQKDVPIYVVLTMRSDFIGECGQFEGLAEMVNRGEFLIPRLTREQYKRVIEGPIKVAGGKIAPRLLQRLLNDLGQQADQLPCLQHALMRTWNVWAEKGDADELDLDDYQRVGKMSQALSLHADEIFESLSSDRERDVCRGLFQALTVEESNNRGIRRPQRLGRLCQILEVSAAELHPIIDAYRHSGVTFLMPSPEVELTDQTIIDISHESLMRVWTRLRHWVEEESQAVGIYRRLSESAGLHAEGRAGLYRDPELGIALAWRAEKRPNQAWAERYRAGFDHAMEFLERSHQAQLADEQAHEVSRQRELEQARQLAEAQQQRAEIEQRTSRRLRGLAVVMAVVAVFAVGASVVAFRSWQDADAARLTAQSSEQSARNSAETAKREAERATTQETKATEARQDAEESLTAARTAIDEFLVQVSDSKLLSTPGLQPLRADLLESAGKFYSEFLAKNPNDPRLQAGLADAFFRVGFVNGEMGRYEQSIASLEKSIALQEAALKARPGDADLRHRLAKAWYECSASQLRREDLSSADESARHAARLWDALSLEFPENIAYRKSLARACNIMGIASSNGGDYERSYLAYQRAMQIRLELLEHHPQDVEVLHGLGESFGNIGHLVTDVEQRLSMTERAMSYGAIAHQLSPQNVEYAIDHALSYLGKGQSLISLNRKPQALESWRNGVEHCLAFIRANPAVPGMRDQLKTLLSHVRYYPYDAAQADEYANVFRAVRTTFAELPRQTAEDHFEWAQVQSDCAQQLFRARRTFQNRALTSQEDADIAAWRSGSLAALNEALALGLKDTWRLKQDDLLADVRTQPTFNELLTKLDAAEKAPAATAATGTTPMPDAVPIDRSVQVAQDRAAGFMAYGVVETWLTQADLANKSFDEALALRQSLADASPDNIQRLINVIEVREARIRLCRVSGQLGQAREQFSQGVAELEQVLARNLTDADMLLASKTLATIERDYADFLAESGLWDEAGQHYAKSLRHSLKHRELLRKTAPTGLLQSEQVYEEILSSMLALLESSGTSFPEACQQVLSKFQNTTNNEQATRVARLCVIVPNAVPDLTPILALADKAQTYWHAYTRGLVRYRMGRFNEAIQIIQSAQQKKDLAGVGLEDFVVAMAYFQTGRKEQAIKLLAETNAKSPRTMHEWTHSPHNMLDGDWLILRREANQLIHGSPYSNHDQIRRGRAFAQLGDPENAKAEFAAGLQSLIDYPLGHFEYAHALATAGRQEEAAQILDKARQLRDEQRNTDVECWRLESATLSLLDRRDESVAALRQVRSGQILKFLQAPQSWPTRQSFLMLNEELANALRSAGREAEATAVTEERDALLAGMRLRPVLQSISDTFAETQPHDAQLSASLIALDRLLAPTSSLSSGTDPVDRTLHARLLQERSTRRRDAGRQEESVEDLTAARAEYEQLLSSDGHDAELVKNLADILLELSKPAWNVLKPVAMHSEVGAALTILPDQSILSGGQRPEFETYTISFVAKPSVITAIRLDALPDPSLPNNGPGRFVNGVFELSELEVVAEGGAAVKSQNAPPVSLAIDRAVATATQSDITSVFDRAPESYWTSYPHTGRPVSCVLRLSKPLRVEEGTRLTFKLLFRDRQYPGALLGRFRISVTDDPARFDQETRRFAAQEFAEPWAKLGAVYSLAGDQTRAVNDFVTASGRTTDLSKRSALARQIAKFITPDAELLAEFVKRNHEQPVLMVEVAKQLSDPGESDVAKSLRTKARTLLETQLAREPVNADVQSSLADILLQSSDLKWTILSPTEMTSQGGATLTKLEDNSILASGTNPPTDRYAITVTLPDAIAIHSIRLEALPHDSLPLGGPGRSISGVFAMMNWDVTAMRPSDSTPRPLVFQGGTADVEYPSFPVTSKGQWNISGAKSGNDHTAVWTLPEAVNLEAGTKLHFQMEFNKSTNYADQNLGRFRLSATADSTAFPREQRRFAAMKLTDPQTKLAAVYLLNGDSERALPLLPNSSAQAKLLIDAWISSGAPLDGILDLLKDRAPDVYPAALPDAARDAAEQGKLDLSRSLYTRLIALQPENALWKERAAQLQPGTLAVWNFDSTAGSWGRPFNCEMSVKDGVLSTRPTATDCGLSTLINAPADGKVFALKYRSQRDFRLQIYWSDTPSNFPDTRMQAFSIPASADNWRDIMLPFACVNELTALRFDPETGVGNSLEIDSIVLRHVERDEHQRLAKELVIEPELARLNQAIAADPKSSARLVERGNLFLRLGRWREALADFEQDRALNPTSRFVWFRSANCLLLAGDEAGYKKLCLDMVEQFRGTTDAQVADSVSKTCLLRPGTIELSELPIQMLRTAIDDPKQTGFHNWFLGVTALYSYREGKFDEAIAWTKRNPNPTWQTGALALVVRAMAEHQLGQHEQARQTLAQVDALIPGELRTLGTAEDTTLVPIPTASIATDWLTPELLRREAAQLIK